MASGKINKEIAFFLDTKQASYQHVTFGICGAKWKEKQSRGFNQMPLEVACDWAEVLCLGDLLSPQDLWRSGLRYIMKSDTRWAKTAMDIKIYAKMNVELSRDIIIPIFE